MPVGVIEGVFFKNLAQQLNQLGNYQAGLGLLDTTTTFGTTINTAMSQQPNFHCRINHPISNGLPTISNGLPIPTLTTPLDWLRRRVKEVCWNPKELP